MLANRAAVPFHEACGIAFLFFPLAKRQNTIKETKEPETYFPALQRATLCIVKFSTVLKNYKLLHLQNTEGSVFADRCALLQNFQDPSCFHSLPSTRNGSSQMPFLFTNLWFQLFTLPASNPLAVCDLDSCEAEITERFWVRFLTSCPHLSPYIRAPGHSCYEDCLLEG